MTSTFNLDQSKIFLFGKELNSRDKVVKTTICYCVVALRISHWQKSNFKSDEIQTKHNQTWQVLQLVLKSVSLQAHKTFAPS